jgi:hypothetical protein
MLTRYHSFVCLLFIISFAATSQSLDKLASIDFEQADFFLLDVTDNNIKVTSSIDAYRHQGDFYIAITPLFEGLRLKYSLIGDKLSVTFADKTTEFDFVEKQAVNGQWFNDGSFIFVRASILEQLFSTKITINTNILRMNFLGHTQEFPYKTIKNNQNQRKFNNYISDDTSEMEKNGANSIITIEDRYRLATVPTGYANLEYKVSDKRESYDATIQMESDLAYHSASITLVNDGEDTQSRVLLSRYPQFTGDKILGIWDTYSLGDLYLTKSSLTEGSSRGLGINLSANIASNFNENMTTSFSKVARPGWDADIYHNGVFLETRVVPADGLMEFNNLEVYYGANEFKIVLYGPYGEQETLFEKISVKSNSLAQGDISYGLSIQENDSSLLDINPSEFDIDAISGRFNIGLFNNWQVGLNVNLNDIHNPNGGSESYIISNQVTFPGWFIQNNTAINENDISQSSSFATSFFNNDNFTLKYNSQWNNGDDDNRLDYSLLDMNYQMKWGPTTNNIRYNYNDSGQFKSENLSYQFNFHNKYLNVSNSLSYIRNNDREDILFGRLNLTTSVNRIFRVITTIPYDISGEEAVDPEQISASVLYNYVSGEYNHSVNVSNRSFFKDNLWLVGYNLAINKPTHQFILRTQYNSQDAWSLTAGITINFGYDYFNNALQLSSSSLRGAGSIDVHTYLDRRLNGLPDVLDYNLADVTFTGGQNWENIRTNQDGRAKLFGANNGVTALSANWNSDSGAATLNNDYLIYSHPGSLQRVNLPFYLTTELEFFVLLGSNSQAVTLTNVPLVASNISTGDEYTIETDFDGYANFVDLLPGKYHIYVDKKYMQEKGLQAEIGGFELHTPLKGGFVELPNIELSRSESGGLGDNKLLKVTLDETNYAPLLYTDNDKLIHLPPKGGMKAPHSSDELDRRVFNRIRMQSTVQERKELRSKLATAAESSRQFQPGRTQTNQDTFKTESDTRLANTQKAEGTVNTNLALSEELDKQSPLVIVTPLKPDNVTNDQDTQLLATVNVSTQDIAVENSDTKLDLSSGYVVQYSALKSLDIARTLTQNFPNTAQLHIVRKVVNGESYYCLISRVLPDQISATRYLNTAEKEGFIVEATNYLDPIWSK